MLFYGYETNLFFVTFHKIYKQLVFFFFKYGGYSLSVQPPNWRNRIFVSVYSLMRVASPSMKILYWPDLWDTIFCLLISGLSGWKEPAAKITSKQYRKRGNRKSPYTRTS